MENISMKKVFGETPTNVFEAIKLMQKAQFEVVDAANIMQSIVDNPEEMKFHIHRINSFLNKFKDEAVTAG